MSQEATANLGYVELSPSRDEIGGARVAKHLPGSTLLESRLLKKLSPPIGAKSSSANVQTPTKKSGLLGPVVNVAGPSLAEARPVEEAAPTTEQLKGPSINTTLLGPSVSERLALQQLHENEGLAGPGLNDVLFGPSASEARLLDTQAATKHSLIGPGLNAAISGPSQAERQILTDTLSQNSGHVGPVISEALEGPSQAEARLLQEQQRDGMGLKGPQIYDALSGHCEQESKREGVGMQWIAKVDLNEKLSQREDTVLTGEVCSKVDRRAINAVFEYWYRHGMGEEVTEDSMCLKYDVTVDVFNSYASQLTPLSTEKLIQAGQRGAVRSKQASAAKASPASEIVPKPRKTRAPIEERHPLDSANDPVQTPLRAEDFVGVERLSLLLLPDQLGRTCLRLLDARELIRMGAEGGEGGRMQRRQDLERDRPQVFCTPALTKQLLDETAAEREGVDVDGAGVAFYPGIVAVSYAWATDQHPDPGGEQLVGLARALEWYMSERARLRARVKRAVGEGEGRVEVGEAPSTALFGVFVDFMCVHQAPLLGHEGEYQRREKGCMGALYGHQRTVTMQAADTHGGSGERAWERRGWCRVEGRLSELAAPRDHCLHLAAFPLSPAAKTHTLGSPAAYRKSGAQLAGQGDGHATLRFLSAMAPPPRAPLAPDLIWRELEGLAFGEEGDRELCGGLYAEAAAAALGAREGLLLAGRRLSAAEVSQLPAALNACHALRRLEIAKSALTGPGLAAVLGGLEAGAVPRLSRLDLSENPLADAAAAPLALAMGALLHTAPCACLSPPRPPQGPPVLSGLAELILEECGVGPHGFGVLVEAAGGLRGLLALNLSLNPAGDAGMRMWQRIGRGAFAGLQDLRLAGCDVGDGGALWLVEAVGAGMLPDIHRAHCRDTPAIDLSKNSLEHAPAALDAVLRERWAGGGGGGHGVLGAHQSAAAAVSKLRESIPHKSGGCVLS